MNAGEANVLLTKAALVDRWMKFGTPQELAAAANEWAIVLVDVPLDVALEALSSHYATERRSIMPADIVDFAPPLRSSSHAGNVTEQRLARGTREICDTGTASAPCTGCPDCKGITYDLPEGS